MANKGKFINTSHSDNINTVVQNAKDIIKNPYYVYANRYPTIVTYFNINKEMSTLDEGFKGVMADYGKDCPLWHNKIIGFYLYGLEQLQIQMEHGEFGAEASEITGEAIILPNSIIPYPGDYFKISYIKEDFMFRVTGVSFDTLENESNLYKVQYKLESSINHDEDFNIKDTYRFISNNVGTSFNCILREEKIDLIELLEAFLERLKKYYIDIFYNDRVQSFIYMYKHMRFYDPYMIQFLKNNGILEGAEEYVYITHQLCLRNYFNIEYDKTFFGCLEMKDFKNVRKYNIDAISRHIGGIDTSIFSSRPEEYLEVDFRHNVEMDSMYGILPCFPADLLDYIESKELFYEDDMCMYNIIVKYANNMDLTDKDLNMDYFEFKNNIRTFYIIPAIIFCLESIIKRMMTNDSNK